MAQTETTIRQAGPYTVTTNGSWNLVMVNGRLCNLIILPAPQGAVVAHVDTGITGKNGKRDVVGLTAEQLAIHTATRAVVEASPEYAATQAAAKARHAAEAAYDAQYSRTIRALHTGRG